MHWYTYYIITGWTSRVTVLIQIPASGQLHLYSSCNVEKWTCQRHRYSNTPAYVAYLLRATHALHTRANSCVHEIGRAPKEGVRSPSQDTSKSCSVVTGVLKCGVVWCEVICGRSLNQMLFRWISIHARSLHMIRYGKLTMVRLRSAMVSRFCVRLTSERSRF